MAITVNQQPIMPSTTATTADSNHIVFNKASSPQMNLPNVAMLSFNQHECSNVTQVDSNAVAKVAEAEKENMCRSHLLRLYRDKKLEPDSEEFAELLDALDPLARLRQEFCFPLCRTLPAGVWTNISSIENCGSSQAPGRL